MPAPSPPKDHVEDIKESVDPEPLTDVEPVEEFPPSSDATVKEDEIRPTDVNIPEITMDKEKTNVDEDLSKKLKPKKQVKFDEDSLNKEPVVVVESAIKDQQKSIAEDDNINLQIKAEDIEQQIMKSPEPTKKKKIKKVKKSKEKSLAQEEGDNQQPPETKTDNITDIDTATIETALLLKDSETESSLDTTSTDLLDSKDVPKDTTIINKVVESTEIPPPKIDQSKDDNIPLKHELLKDISKDDIPKDEPKTEEPKDTSKDTTMPNNTQTETPETLQIIPETQDSPTVVADTSVASVGRVREETKVILRI